MESKPTDNSISALSSSGKGSSDEGTIDHIFNVLDIYKHPFVLVGQVAHRWMGCASCVDGAFDIVLRNDQLDVIVTDLIKTGHWILFDPHRERQILESDSFRPRSELHEHEMLLKYLCDADTVLRQVDLEGLRFEYLRIWSEETYQIKVDDCSFVEVPELHPWSPFLVENEFHPAIQRKDGWWYGPSTLDKASDRYRIFSTIFPRAKGPNNHSPICILSIPTYLDALVYHMTHYKISKPELYSIADWQIGNLTSYLYLELPHQKDALLFQIEAKTEDYMQPYLERYTVLNETKEIVLVNDWDPMSFPECIRKTWVGQLGHYHLGPAHPTSHHT
jgi:hypothetical protein